MNKDVQNNLYRTASENERIEYYKLWLLSTGMVNPAGYYGIYARKIRASHGINIFEHVNREVLLKLLPLEEINIANDHKQSRDCRSAYKKYLKFLSELEKGVTIGHVQPTKNRTVKSSKIDWPVWDQPDEEQLLLTAKIGAPYFRFLNPTIVEAIVIDNEKNGVKWRQQLAGKGIDADLYLWPGSSCTFPGVRRYAGKVETNNFYQGNNLIYKNAVSVDDNKYPKQLWSFVFRNKKFANFGPTGYVLAHLIDHKDHKNRSKNEFDYDEQVEINTLYGLYTCASNSIYIPTSLYKPTDHSIQLRNLLFRRAKQLYGDVCALVPNSMKIKEVHSIKWELDEFNWAEPVGNLDNIKVFLNFRQEQMMKFLS